MTRNKNVGVRVAPAAEGTLIRANDDRLRQVLINILSNAVKYNTAVMPTIRIVSTVKNDKVWIDIVDNGGGVTRAESSMIFEKFARGARADRDQGAGLGLPISRAIMRAMNGDLTIEFARDGTSFFRLSLGRVK